VRVVSTFAGCGGSSLGYEQAGHEVVAAVEWDEHAAACYRLNHPDTPVLQRDITDVTGAELLDAAGLSPGEVDMLDGSPPCQGFSSAGQRLLDDPRNALFRQHLRLLDELQPRHAVIENVSGMVRGKMRVVAAEIVQALKDRGYAVAAGVLEAQYFGVAQRRPRVFFMASREGQPELPRPRTRATAAGDALRGVDPGEYPSTTPGTGVHYLAQHLRPGETGADVRKRHGVDRPGEGKWFGSSMLHPRQPSHTIVKNGPTHVYHWTRRLISVREALVLTGFPVDYQLEGSHGKRWARVGNAVAPPVARAVIEQLEIL